MKTSYLLVLPVALLCACNSNQEIVSNSVPSPLTQNSVIQPIAGINNNPSIYSVDALRPDTVLLPNGGSIVFPENSFVDAKGNPVKGEVDIHWQEFHSFGDIALSGIPMKYDSAGVQFDLVSGGMFTISATQKNQEVQLAKGKQATVNLVSMQDTPCYNFYELDTKTGDWDYQTTAEGEVVAAKKSVPVANRQQHIIEMVVDTRGMSDVDARDILGWIPVEPLDAETQSWLKSNYAATKMLRNNADGSYQVEVKIRKKTMELRLEPYTMDDARRDRQKNEAALQSNMNEIMAYQEKLAAGKIVRTIEIPDFGTYNWDICNKRTNSVICQAEFDFPVKADKKLITLFLISPDENAIIKYDANGDKNFSYDPSLRNCLIALTPDNRLLVVDKNSFNKAPKSTRFGKPIIQYEFRDAGVTVHAPSDIENHLPKFI